MEKDTVKNHWSVILIAFILGFLMVWPFFNFQIALGPEYKGIQPQFANDELFYLARIKDVIDGHPFLSNAYLYEHKSGLPQNVFLAEYLLAQPIKLLGINMNAGHLIYNFLFPAITFLLTYAAFYLILRRKSQSLISTGFLFFGLYPLAFIRPVSPQFNFIFWLTQFILIWLFINGRSRKILFLSIVNFGFLFYIYPYYWTFYLIFFGILAVIYFIRDRALAFRVAGSALGGLILAIPYFYFNYLSSRLPEYAEILTRLGMIYSRFPSGIRIIFYTIFGLALFAWALRKKVIRFNVKTMFYVSGILANAVAVNQHIITGRNFEFSSHYDMGAVFFLAFAVAYLLSNIKIKWKSSANFTIIFIAAAVIAGGLHDYSKRAFSVAEDAVYQQKYALIFEWLDKNTEKDSVVYANAELSGLIPVYTANNIFFHRFANLFFISDEEVLDRFILNNFFEKFDHDFVFQSIRSIFGVRYIDKYGHTIQVNKLKRLFGLKTEPEILLPEKEIEKVISRAEELQKEKLKDHLRDYRVDYIIWDRQRNPDWKIDKKDFKRAVDIGQVSIFANSE